MFLGSLLIDRIKYDNFEIEIANRKKLIVINMNYAKSNLNLLYC